jgi:hypothetical protein
VIDHLIGAELSSRIHSLPRCGGDDIGTVKMGQLDSVGADPAGATMDENSFVLGKAAVMEQTLYGCEPGQGDGG